MGVCDKLWAGQDNTCSTLDTRYFQQVVLVNREDVEESLIQTPIVNLFGNYLCRHRVFFKLKEGKSGFRYSLNENASSIYATADKVEQDRIVGYVHSVNIAITGVDEQTKCLLSQLDRSDYFAAVQYYDGTVEIYGFEFGLTTSGYSYDPASNYGGQIIKLISREETPETELPLVYRTIPGGNEIRDFDNNFENVEFVLPGDFNDDFNDDFNNIEP